MHPMMRANLLRFYQPLFALAFIFLLVGCATATIPPQPVTPQPPTSPQPAQSAPARQEALIVVVGNGNMFVKANLTQVNFSIDVVDDTVLAANRAANETVERVLDALADASIAESDINPYSYNVYAERYYEDYERDDPGTVPLIADVDEEIRYRVIHQISVKIRDLDSIPAVVDTIVEAGGNNAYIYGTDFLYDDPEGLEHAAREKAVADAQRKAEAIAEEIGVELGPVVAISEFVQGSGVLWDSYMPPIWPGQLQFYLHLQITYAIDGAIDGTDVATPTVTAMPTLTATTAPTVSAAVTTSELVTIYGGDEASLRKFLRYNYIMPFPGGEDTTTSVYIGVLPPELPFTITLLDGMTTIGSVMSTGEYGSSQLLLRQDGDVTESVAALRQQFTDQGYVKLAGAPNGEIFQTQTGDYIPQCSPDNTHNVVVSGRNLPDGTGIIRYFINNMVPGTSPCVNPSMGQSGGNASEYESVMPNLAAPPNVGTYQSSMGSTGDSLESTIAFSGDTTVAALAEHYFSQLEAQGWQQIEASQTEHVAWSSWAIEQEGKRYAATFYILREGESDNRFEATLRLTYRR